MSEDVDAGDIVDQVEVIVDDIDTADSLYQKLKSAERQLFRRNIDQIASGRVPRQPQIGEGSFRRRAELFDPAIQKIDLDETLRVGDLLKRLRALTSSKREEAAYFISGGKRVRVRIELEVAAD
jgi:methionyl-tRNA formyltransferase